MTDPTIALTDAQSDAPPTTPSPTATSASDTRLLTVLHAAVEALGGTERPGQVAMAQAVASAMEREEHLVVQAGTGTGKSLAYLVPAVLHGERVVVATATIALQAQLVERDLPRLAAAVAPVLGRTPTYALVKGRANYACLNRIRGGVPDEQGELVEVAPSSTLGREVLRVRRWAETSPTGDRDELRPGVSDRAWAQVSVSARECLGADRCPEGTSCFAERSRWAARKADVVVTNHALLAIDAIHGRTVLPEHDVLVVDEGHELVSRVTGAASEELSSGLVERAARFARNAVGAELADPMEDAAGGLAFALEDAPVGRLEHLPADLAAALAVVRDTARAVMSALGKAVAKERGEADALPVAGADADTPAGGVAYLRRVSALVGQVFDTSARLVSGAEDDVAWLEDRERGGRTLRVAPLSVAELLSGRVFADRTVVLTSATLALGGSFAGVAQQVGLSGPPRTPGDGSLSAAPPRRGVVRDTGIGAGGPAASHAAATGGTNAEAEAGADDASDADADADAEPRTTSRPVARTPADDDPDAEPEVDRTAWAALDVGSPFDYGRQAMLYVAKALPPPGRDGPNPLVLAELVELVAAAGGRTLGLFSSRRGAEAAAAHLRDHVSTPVLCQGDDGLAELGRRFQDDPAASLLGTLSLWQGIDVPGATCTLVVIDRIPFPRPDDPLASARQRAVEKAGGNGFMAVAAAHAGLLLAQGSGRLIRTLADRGVVAVLDPRLATARYRDYLLRSMPPMWRTSDREVALAALRRLDVEARLVEQGATASSA